MNNRAGLVGYAIAFAAGIVAGIILVQKFGGLF